MKVTVVNSISSGKYLIKSLEDIGATVMKIYEGHLKPDHGFFLFFQTLMKLSLTLKFMGLNL